MQGASRRCIEVGYLKAMLGCCNRGEADSLLDRHSTIYRPSRPTSKTQFPAMQTQQPVTMNLGYTAGASSPSARRAGAPASGMRSRDGYAGQRAVRGISLRTPRSARPRRADALIAATR